MNAKELKGKSGTATLALKRSFWVIFCRAPHCSHIELIFLSCSALLLRRPLWIFCHQTILALKFRWL